MQGNSPYVEKLPEFDLSQCQAVDFSELLLDTYDWGGQIRANNIGKTIFHPNGIELLEGADKNAAFIRDGAAYSNFYIDFKLNMTVTEEFLDRGIGDWIFLFTFRDSNPVYNTWDQTSKNAYGILATYDPVSNVSTLLLRRFNNSAGSMVTTELASVGGLDMMYKSSTFSVGTYNTGKGVRIAVWMDGKKIIDLEDTDENAVTQAGSFMIGQHGVVQNTSIPIVRSLLFEGLLPGEDRPSYTLGVNEPKQESAKLYPRDVYELSDLTDLPVQTESISEGQGIAAAVLLIAAIAVVAAAGAVTVILLIRKKGGKQA